jgi:O-antigen ligase
VNGINGRPPGLGWRLEVALCAGVTGVIFGQFVALGANTPLLAAAGATAELILALMVVALSARAVNTGLWLRMFPVMSLLIAAMAWALWPQWAVLVPLIRTLPGWRVSLAPDSDTLEVIKLAGATAIGLSAALIARSRLRAIRLVRWLVVSGGLYVVLSLWLWRTDPFSVWGVPKGAHTWSFTGSLLNANAAGCIFGMISLLSLGLTQSMSRSLDLHAPRLRELMLFGAAGFGVVGALAATALTGSRTGLLLTAVLTTVLAVTDLARIQDRAKLPRVIGAGALGVILLAVALGVGFAPIAAKAGLHKEFTSRFSAYSDYLAAARAAPWSGYGPGSFSTLNASLLPPALMDDRWSFNAAHCAPLQAMLEAGAPFLLLLAAALAVTVGQIVNAWLARGAASAVSIAALAAGLLAFGCALVDIALNVPALAAFAATTLGLAWGSSAGLDRPRHRPLPGDAEVEEDA